jgi:hypothetical protein
MPRAGVGVLRYVSDAPAILPTERALCWLVRLSRMSIAEKMRDEHRRRVLGE